MKKNRFFMLCLTLIMGASVATFAGCSDGGGNGDGGAGGSVDSSTEQGSGSGGNSGTSGSQPGGSNTGAATAPELKAMSTYFSGVKAEYDKVNFANQNGQTKTFEELLDKQFDVLAQDLIYRLTYVYGYNENQPNRDEASYNLDFTYNGTNATVTNGKMLLTSLNHDASHSSNPHANCLSCLQNSLTITSGDNKLNNTLTLHLSGAIEGRYLAIENYANSLVSNKDASKAWNWTVDSSTTQNFVAAHKDNLKMALAEICSGATSVNGVYSSANYNAALANINALGINNAYKNKIVDFIKSNVIGSSNISRDENVYNCQYFATNGYALNGPHNFVMTAPYGDPSKFTETEIANSPRLYKAYNFVVPAIVEQAINNKFDGISTSIYPRLHRYGVEYSTNVAGFNNAKQYKSIVLAPKTNTPTTKLIVEVTGNGTSIGKTITVNFDVVIAGTKYSGTKNVSLVSTATEVEFNLNSLTSGSKLNAYDGSTSNYTQTMLFADNNEFDNNGNLVNNDGNNYIKLNFDGKESLIVSFKGLYDKV